ncbi:MAG: HPF/RaiA family ribosome-associated protein [Gemmatimonadota bacterium]
MEIPPEISFRDVDARERHKEKILEEIAKLERVHDRIVGCRVVVEQPHRHADRGGQYHVGIRLSVPRKELVVSRDPGNREAHSDLEIAISDAFASMRRQLEQHAERIRSGRQKGGGSPRFGKIARRVPEEGYGFIRTPDGRDVYFHEDTLVGGSEMDDLHVQTPVRFIEEEGDKGPQAREVHVMSTEPLPETGEAGE